MTVILASKRPSKCRRSFGVNQNVRITPTAFKRTETSDLRSSKQNNSVGCESKMHLLLHTNKLTNSCTELCDKTLSARKLKFQTTAGSNEPARFASDCRGVSFDFRDSVLAHSSQESNKF